MLNKFILRAAFSAVALAGTAAAASAEEYHVLIMDYAFFPEISYVVPGDVIVFENISGETRNILSDNDTWAILDIADSTTASLEITDDMPAQYFSMVQGGEGDVVDENGDVRVDGQMDFNGPPLAVAD
jgi:plastocyanin